MSAEGSAPGEGGLVERACDAVREKLMVRAARLDLDLGSRERVAELLNSLVEEETPLLTEPDRERLVQSVLSEAVGLGSLEPYLRDPEVEEIMVNGTRSVFVERAGRIEQAGVVLQTDDEVLHLMERIIAPLGRRLDEACPLVDARLHDGSRVNCVIPPLSLSGPVLTIRKFRSSGFSPDELVTNGTMCDELRLFLSRCVQGGANVVISGGTGSGKTTTLNALSEYIPSSERVITVEDTAELSLRQPHVIRLEARPANYEGRGEVTIRALVRNALRMRPDRIIVGEVRGGEALDMLQAMNTGHDGSLTTLHANSPVDAIRRVETMAMMADVGLPHSAISQQVASALDLVVHQSRDRDGSRSISAVAEVVRTGAGAGVRDLYLARREGGRWLEDPSPDLATKLGVDVGDGCSSDEAERRRKGAHG